MFKDVRIWRMPRQPDVEFVHVVSLPASLPRQISSTCKLVYFEQGKKRFRYRGGIYTAGASDLLLIPPGAAHGADAPEDAASLRILHLPENAWLQESCFPQWLHACAGPLFVTHPEVLRHFRRLHRKPEAFASELEQQTLLLNLQHSLRTSCVQTTDAKRTAQREAQAIRRLREYLEAHYAEDVSLAQLAQTADLHPAYLCRVFTQSVGMPPHAYLTALRIDRARALLRRGVGVGETAQQTGFYDQSHFVRHFRRFVQMSPSTYARQVKNVQDTHPA